jgi:hypothetical protein
LLLGLLDNYLPMKRILLFAFIIFAFLPVAVAQVSLTFTPGSIDKEGVADPDDLFVEIVGKATLTNDGDEPITIRWERVISDMPEDWVVQVCDLNQCYAAVVYSNIAPDLGLNAPVTLQPGGDTNLDVHVKPTGVAGTGKVTIEVADVNNQDEVLIAADYNFTATMVNSTSTIGQDALSIFPNPTTDYIQLKGGANADRLVIYNIIGRKMRSFNIAPGQRYYIGDFPNGMYLATLLSHRDGVLTTMRVQKSALRP